MPGQEASPEARFVVITGLAGSGKSTALRALEDLGFYAVDNLPAQLLSAFVNLPLRQVEPAFKAALVMDLRDPGFIQTFPRVYENLDREGISLELIFLEAGENALVRRFSQTRRQHPLTRNGESTAEGIAREKNLLRPLRELATQVLDTSRFNVHELRAEITRLFSQDQAPAALQVNLMSFGFKFGLPQEADLVMDVRFLANPFFVPELRDLDGLDEAVVDYVRGDEASSDFVNRFKALLDFLLPRYRREGKRQLTIAVGCTGGHHRSVVVAEWLGALLRSQPYRVTVRHRDIGQE